jgi:rhodanese-related sulfurtransferase/predicted DsbA family dithiol-disulfide isomerase
MKKTNVLLITILSLIVSLIVIIFFMFLKLNDKITKLEVLLQKEQIQDRSKEYSENKILADEISKDFILKEYNDNLYNIFKKNNNNLLASHLNKYLSYLSTISSDKDKITKYLTGRYNFFISKEYLKTGDFNLPKTGNPNAKINIKIYISSSCSTCFKVTSQLYDLVNTGELKGIANLNAIPISSLDADLTLLIAGKKGKYWPALMKIIKTDNIQLYETRLTDITSKLGIDKEWFKEQLKRKEYRDSITNIKETLKEINVVSPTTIVINDKIYDSDINSEWIKDAVLYEYNKNNEEKLNKNGNIYKTITDLDAYNLLISKNEKNIILIDVRTPEEYQTGHLEKSLNIDYNSGDFKNQILKISKNKKIILYCKSGKRSSSSLEIMEKLGFKEVYNIDGGIESWISHNLPIIK